LFEVTYTIKGSVECPDIIREDSNEDFRLANQWWLLGYITARNYEDDADIGLNTEDDKIYALGLDYCRRNPGSDWDDAAIQTYITLSN
jgi:hypothetical protein